MDNCWRWDTQSDHFAPSYIVLLLLAAVVVLIHLLWLTQFLMLPGSLFQDTLGFQSRWHRAEIERVPQNRMRAKKGTPCSFNPLHPCLSAFLAVECEISIYCKCLCYHSAWDGFLPMVSFFTMQGVCEASLLDPGNCCGREMPSMLTECSDSKNTLRPRNSYTVAIPKSCMACCHFHSPLFRPFLGSLDAVDTHHINIGFAFFVLLQVTSHLRMKNPACWVRSAPSLWVSRCQVPI